MWFPLQLFAQAGTQYELTATTCQGVSSQTNSFAVNRALSQVKDRNRKRGRARLESVTIKYTTRTAKQWDLVRSF